MSNYRSYNSYNPDELLAPCSRQWDTRDCFGREETQIRFSQAIMQRVVAASHLPHPDQKYSASFPLTSISTPLEHDEGGLYWEPPPPPPHIHIPMLSGA